MDRQRFEHVQAVFREALLTAPEDLGIFLDSRCGDDGELRRQVEALLTAHREAKGFLEPGSPLAAAAELVGHTLGPYRVIQRLGDGGMGAVYLAERADHAFRMRIAIKVLRPGMVSEELVRSFATERQILAALDHPHIAKLIDGGTTPEGLPYFAMEYVEGKPIGAYCDDRRSSLRQRLELFLVLCDAVAFAHANLVVHRDLKPSNILITGDGVLKLLDFGIAKLLNPELSATSHRTTLAMLHMLTPEYASPEQIRGGMVTTASDVYSLGVLLYELLTGRGPYVLTTGSPTEVLDAVCHRVPEPPSSALSRRPDEGSGPLRRRSDLARLRRRLSGDLDAIVGKALQKTPEQRYASVVLLAEDLRRHLQGLPVRARRSSLPYRASKFVRRYRWQLAAVSALLVTLLVLGGWLAREKARAEAALEQVEQERDRSERLAEFMVALFAAPNPRTDREHTLTATDMLERGAEKLLAELSDQPGVQARARTEIGQILGELGEYDLAVTLLQGAVATGQELGDDRGLARSLSVLASLHIQQGELGDAERELHQARALVEPSVDGPDQDLANILHELGVVALHQGRWSEAGRHVVDALAMHRAMGGDRVDEAQMLNTLGAVRHREGNLEEAESLYRQTLALRLDVLGPDHLAVSETQNNLAALLTIRGKPREARELAEAALATRRNLLGDRHPLVATAWHNLGGALRDLGDLEAAEQAFRTAVSIHEETLGRSHAYTAGSLLRLAAVLEDLGRRDEAERCYRDSLAIHRATLGKEHAKSGEAALYLARFLRSAGDAAQALPLATQAETTLRAARGDDHWQTAAAATVRAACLLDLGDAAAGRATLAAHLPTLQRARDPQAARFLAGAQEAVHGMPPARE